MSAFALLLAGALSLQQGGITISSELSSPTTTVGEPVTLTITVRSSASERSALEVPTLPRGLRIIGSSTQTSIEIAVPGGRTDVTRRIFEVMATQPGTFTIPPAGVRVAGRVRLSDPLQLVVTGAPAATDLPGAEPGGGVRLRATAEPRDPYVGEQIMLRLEAILPSDPRFRPTQPPVYDPPSPAGFWVQDLPEAISARYELINGQTTEIRTYRRADFPLTPGTFSIPPARLMYDVRGGVFYAPESRTIASAAIPITVRPLPDEGKPASFRGAVGTFQIMAAADRSEAVVGDAIRYRLTIEGTGNMKALPPPELPELSDVDVYPPSEDASLVVTNGNVGGTRSFEWVLVPRTTGTVRIPALEYSWFDPQLEQYVTHSAPAVDIAITSATGMGAAEGNTAIAPIRVRPHRTAAMFVASPLFALLLALPLAIIGLFVMARRAALKSAVRRQQRAAVNERIATIETLATANPRDFYAAATRFVSEIRSQAGDASLHARCDQLTARFRAALYAPALPPDSERLEDVAAIRSLAAVTAGRSGTTAHAIVALLFCAFVAVNGRVLYAQAPDDFAVGVAALQANDFNTAAARLDRYVAGNPHDASAWYDLGIAHYGLGDPGRAAWAWLHAAALEPREPDVHRNLRRVNASEAAWYFVPVSTAELGIAAAAAWWLLSFALAWYLLTRRRAARIAALVLGLFIATLLSVIGMRVGAAERVVAFGTGTVLYGAPTERSEQKGELAAGVAAEVVRREGGWMLVRRPDLVEGWVDAVTVGTF